MSTPTTARKTTTAKAPPRGNTTTGAPAAGEVKQKSLQQHLVTVAEPDVMDPQGLYEFCESCGRSAPAWRSSPTQQARSSTWPRAGAPRRPPTAA